MKPATIHEDLDLQRGHLAAACRALYRLGWMPGTSGNVSIRSGEGVMITASGRSKGTMAPEDTVIVDPVDGRPLVGETERPSAETSIHLAVYRQVSGCGAVVHAHAPYSTALATLTGTGTGTGTGGSVGRVVFRELELAKGLGVAAPRLVEVPVFANWPDVSRIADDVTVCLRETSDVPPALLIDRHGVTTWGGDLDEARNRLECVEELSRLTLLTGAFGPAVAKETAR
ncbi:methylthioribulose 1-phosphate dehydratase [Streptomyces sp. NPDC094437]|uniref:methylthioribulose 1-phosphate dehydratase n=1 Tax=Streptomyces sp. NPDC094437 TaxID=3366060 RepID=UPI0038120BAE